MSTVEERRLAAQIAGLRREVRAATTTTQLGYSSVDNGGAILFTDADGRPALEVGRSTTDGSYGAVVRTGTTPPTPTAPTLTPTPAGITVHWDGEYTDSLMTPDDYSRVEVHLSDNPDFTGASSLDLVGTIESPRGGDVPVVKLTPGTTYYVLLVARNTAGGRGPSSLKATAVPLEHPDGPGVGQALSAAEQAAQRAREAREAADAASATANSADQKALDAQTAATAAVAAADGKSKLWYSLSAPTTEGNDGDMWWQRDSTNGPVTHVYAKANGSWQERTLSASTIDSITAGQIKTGTLGVGVSITTGNESGVHTVLGESSLQVWRPDGEGVPQPTISIGGADRDVLMITDPTTGSTLAGFDGDGGGSAITFNTDQLTVGGSPLGNMYDPDDVLFQLPRGRVARFVIGKDSAQAAATPIGIAEVAADLDSDREYRVRFSGNILSTTVGTYRMFYWWTRDGSTPTVNSRQMTMGVFTAAYAGLHSRCELEGNFYLPSADGDVQTVRILLGIQKLTGGGTSRFYSDSGQTPGYLYIEDMGLKPMNGSEVWGDGQMNTGAGTPNTGEPTTTPAGVKKTFTKAYQASWSRTWRSGSVRSDTTDLVQGNYSGQQYGAFGAPAAMLNDIKGTTITKLEVYLYANNWWYNNGGTGILGVHSLASAPPTFPGGSATITKKWRTKTGGLWVTLPSTWYSNWSSGSTKGVTLGDGASSSQSYYGRFNGVGASANRPAFRVTYQK